MYCAAEPLYAGTLQVETVAYDLLRQADPTLPTFINCRAYRALLWTGIKTGNAPISYTVRGGSEHGWQWTYAGVITAAAGQWFREVIRLPRRMAWLRVEVSGATQTLVSKIVGVRG